MLFKFRKNIHNTLVRFILKYSLYIDLPSTHLYTHSRVKSIIFLVNLYKCITSQIINVTDNIELNRAMRHGVSLRL